MLAELYLRVAADPNAMRSLTQAELGELLAEPVPPLWVFTEAARRRHDVTVMARLFAHPEAPRDVLRQAVGSDAKRLERFEHHVNVYAGPLPTLKASLQRVLPEDGEKRLSPAQEQLVVSTLSPQCLLRLWCSVRSSAAQTLTHQRLKEELGNEAWFTPCTTSVPLPRTYSPFSRFLLLGDFLHYLTCKIVQHPHDLPVLAKVALALNPQQPLAPQLEAADVRVRVAAKERKTWSEN